MTDTAATVDLVEALATHGYAVANRYLLPGLCDALRQEAEALAKLVGKTTKAWSSATRSNKGLKAVADPIEKVAEAAYDLMQQIDHVSKLLTRLGDVAEKELGAKDSSDWITRDVKAALHALDDARASVVEHLRRVRYWYRQAHWLQERFPDAALRDVEGLVKLVSYDELEKNDWSLAPGRYVGVAKEEEDENFNFEETMREIHGELADLNVEAAELAVTIARNFEALGI